MEEVEDSDSEIEITPIISPPPNFDILF